MPSARDATGGAFESRLTAELLSKLTRKFVHQERGGAPADYRALKAALDTIAHIAEKQASDLWSELNQALPVGHVTEARFDFNAGTDQLARWFAQASALKTSSGSHDERMVSPSELGSGTQSLLLMCLLRLGPGRGATLLLEEPEAFLHPSAQRALARSLFDDQSVRVIASTHSPVIVDEAVAADVVLVREHKVFAPRDLDVRRRQINSALLTGQGSEAIFSSSVLLVEGAGDRAFFETLRRRLGEFIDIGTLSQLGIVAVGGKARFGPWIQLLQSYSDRHNGDRPIEWIAAADGVDAATDLARGLRDGGISIEASLDRRLREISQSNSVGEILRASRLCRSFNDSAKSLGLRAALIPIDLEYAALYSARPQTIHRIASHLELDLNSHDELLARLGSKGAPEGPSRNPLKHDWIRAEIAKELPWREISADVKGILRSWLAPVLGPDTTFPRPLGNRRVRNDRGRTRSAAAEGHNRAGAAVNEPEL